MAGITRPSYLAGMANIASGLPDGGVPGPCCICGTHGKLSFEHVPPKRAFNDHGVFEADVKKMLENGWEPGVKPDGRINQKGAGRFTLCDRCNNATGSWYGTPYIAVAKQAMELLHRSGGDVSLAYPYRMYPLRFLKQVVTMFFSACGPSFRRRTRTSLGSFSTARRVRSLRKSSFTHISITRTLQRCANPGSPAS